MVIISLLNYTCVVHNHLSAAAASALDYQWNVQCLICHHLHVKELFTQETIYCHIAVTWLTALLMILPYFDKQLSVMALDVT
jgi:hypothetical protein